MNQERILLAEGFTNIIAGAGLWYYLGTILMNRTRSLLEGRLSFLLSLVGALFIVRGVSYTTGLTADFSPYVFLLSIVFPLATALFVEALLRRHLPLQLKLLMTIATIALIPFAFVEEKSTLFYASVITYQASVLIWLGYLIIQRDKKSLSEAENRLINGVAFACAVAVPLLMSDYRTVFGWNLMRMGALGGLVFCLSTIKFSEKSTKREVVQEFVHILLTDLLGTLLFCLVWNEFDYFALAYVVFLTAHLLILILKELTLMHETRMQEWIFPVVDAIEQKQVQSVGDLHELLSLRLGNASVLFLSEDAMGEYDVPSIREYLKDKSQLTLGELKRTGNDPAAQQLAYALDSHQMNQVHLVHVAPLLMIFTNTPAYKGAAAYEKEMKILKSFIALLERTHV